MIFAKVDVDLSDHPKAYAAGVEAMGLWLWGLLYCRKHETDGAIPVAAVESALGGKNNQELVHRLLGACLWTKSKGIFLVLNYAKKNETKAQVTERRSSEAARKQAYRSRLSRGDMAGTTAGSPASCPGSGSDSVNSLKSLEGSAEGGAVDASEPTIAQKMAMRELEYRTAYCAGVAEGKGGPYSWPGGLYEQGTLNECIKTFGKGKHGKPFKGPNVLEWISDWSHDFASEVLARGEVQYYSAFGPKGFRKWLNEQSIKQLEKEVG